MSPDRQIGYGGRRSTLLATIDEDECPGGGRAHDQAPGDGRFDRGLPLPLDCPAWRRVAGAKPHATEWFPGRLVPRTLRRFASGWHRGNCTARGGVPSGKRVATTEAERNADDQR